MTVRGQTRGREREKKTKIALLVCCVVLQACNKAQNVTGSNRCPQAAWDCGDLCSGMCVCTFDETRT